MRNRSGKSLTRDTVTRPPIEAVAAWFRWFFRRGVRSPILLNMRPGHSTGGQQMNAPLSSNLVADWPRDPANGRLLCAPGRPMPKGAAGRWAHTNVETVSSTGDFSTGQEWDRCRCKDCGEEWEHEVPQ